MSRLPPAWRNIGKITLWIYGLKLLISWCCRTVSVKISEFIWSCSFKIDAQPSCHKLAGRIKGRRVRCYQQTMQAERTTAGIHGRWRKQIHRCILQRSGQFTIPGEALKELGAPLDPEGPLKSRLSARMALQFIRCPMSVGSGPSLQVWEEKDLSPRAMLSSSLSPVISLLPGIGNP